ncbi:MAG: UDP-N-acetylmuramate dehydrogenase [Clostridiales bacterium]|nr:UDP-N-acetylmuramate dehydrogenase [Clostridiales bacterium]
MGITVKENVPMSQYTSFKIGGNADIMAFPSSDEQMVSLLKLCKENSVPRFILGNGSNLLVSDEGISGVVINTEGLLNIEYEGDGVINCGAGASLSKLCNFALDNCLTGLEFAFGIPGSVGGAVYMNAGAYGGEMKDVLLDCTYISDDLSVKTMPVADMDFGYRSSVFSKNNGVVLSARVKLGPGDKKDIKNKMSEIIERRRDKQPLEYPSAGSVFKRPEGYFAGALIEQSGLKGKTVGGAAVSEKHAGFIINKGGASAADVKDLIKHIQSLVLENFGVSLETEIKMIGKEGDSK